MRALRRFHPNARSLIAAGLAILTVLLALALAALYGPQSASPARVRLSVATVPTIAQTTTSEGPHHAVASRARRSRPVVRIALPAAGATGTATDAQLWALAGCESGHQRYTRGPFRSYFQFMLSSWRGMGERGVPEDYDYAYQAEVVRRIPLSAWHRQFPVCSRRIGV